MDLNSLVIGFQDGYRPADTRDPRPPARRTRNAISNNIIYCINSIKLFIKNVGMLTGFTSTRSLVTRNLKLNTALGFASCDNTLTRVLYPINNFKHTLPYIRRRTISTSARAKTNVSYLICYIFIKVRKDHIDC